MPKSSIQLDFQSGSLPLRHVSARNNDGEIDFILTAGDFRVPIEVKYQRAMDPLRDTRALCAFMGKRVNRAPIGIIITRDDLDMRLPDDVHAVPLKTLLLAH